MSTSIFSFESLSTISPNKFIVYKYLTFSLNNKVEIDEGSSEIKTASII